MMDREHAEPVHLHVVTIQTLDILGRAYSAFWRQIPWVRMALRHLNGFAGRSSVCVAERCDGLRTAAT